MICSIAAAASATLRRGRHGLAGVNRALMTPTRTASSAGSAHWNRPDRSWRGPRAYDAHHAPAATKTAIVPGSTSRKYGRYIGVVRNQSVSQASVIEDANDRDVRNSSGRAHAAATTATNSPPTHIAAAVTRVAAVRSRPAVTPAGRTARATAVAMNTDARVHGPSRNSSIDACQTMLSIQCRDSNVLWYFASA